MHELGFEFNPICGELIRRMIHQGVERMSDSPEGITVEAIKIAEENLLRFVTALAKETVWLRFSNLREMGLQPELLVLRSRFLQRALGFLTRFPIGRRAPALAALDEATFRNVIKDLCPIWPFVEKWDRHEAGKGL